MATFVFKKKKKKKRREVIVVREYGNKATKRAICEPHTTIELVIVATVSLTILQSPAHIYSYTLNASIRYALMAITSEKL